MNIKLLRRIQARFKRYPKSCNMNVCRPASNPKSKCGCIAHYAEIIGGDKVATWVGQGPLEISDEEARRLIHLLEWPEQFQSAYRRNRAKATIARIEHFIATKGVE